MLHALVEIGLIMKEKGFMNFTAIKIIFDYQFVQIESINVCFSA